MNISIFPSDRSAIILAGGDGKHIRTFVRQLRDFDLPKQYVSFIGRRSLLQHTWDRIDPLIPANRIYTVLTQDHLQFTAVRKQVSLRKNDTVIVQPLNKETGPGLLLSLMYLHEKHPHSSVAVFPSDHFVLQENLFRAYVRRGFETVEAFPNRIVFLGAEPSDPETEYGYILPESSIFDSPDLNIKTFVEEPEPRIAAQLISLGALWNTMVMIFKPQTLLNLIRQSSPELFSAFQQIASTIGTSLESSTLDSVYRRMKSVDFCRDMIPLCDLYSQNHFSVIPMRGVFWSDWGCANRIFSVLERLNYLDRIRTVSIPAEANQVTFEPIESPFIASL